MVRAHYECGRCHRPIADCCDGEQAEEKKQMFNLYKDREDNLRDYYVDDENNFLDFSSIADALAFISGRSDFTKMPEDEAEKILTQNFKHKVVSK